VEVLQEERSIETGPLDSVGVTLGRTVRGGVLAAASAIVFEAFSISSRPQLIVSNSHEQSTKPSTSPTTGAQWDTYTSVDFAFRSSS
jgi:hypothetical protein